MVQCPLDELGDRVARIFQTHLDPHPRLEVPKRCPNRQSKRGAVLLASFSRSLLVEYDVEDPIDEISRWLSHHANLATESASREHAGCPNRQLRGASSATDQATHFMTHTQLTCPTRDPIPKSKWSAR